MRAAIDDHDLVVDSHSFPESEKWGLSSSPDVVFLYDAQYREFATSAARFLRRRNIAAVARAGAPDVNFVITEASRRRVPNVLLEVNEQRPHARAVRTFADYIVSLQYDFAV